MGDIGMPAGRVITADDEGLASAMERMTAVVSRMREGESAFDYVARGPKVIREDVLAIAEALADADAFDVIELMRMREMPMILEDYRESLSDHLPAAIDLVSLILLARGHRVRPGADPKSTRPAAAVSDVHDRASEMLTIGSFTFLASGHKNEFGPLTQLAATYASQDLTVQFKQYLHIHDEINEALFASPHLGDLLVEALGFSYEDFVAVRDSISRVHGERFFAARDVLGEVVLEWDAGGRLNQDAARIQEGQRAFFDMMEYPGRRAGFSAADIAEASRIALERVQAILDTFGVSFDSAHDPVAAVQDFLSGDNPLRNVALIGDGDGLYVSLGRPIGTDCLRQVAEEAFKSNSARWRRYERRRVRVSEELTMTRLSKLLASTSSYANLKYFRANPGVEISALGPQATNVSTVAELTEADGLFFVEDVAVCVEVKAKSLSRQARGGHVRRLSTDLRETVGDATSQALRLEQLIRVNGGLWLEDHSWMDLSGIREIRSIAVCLDDIGPLATALDELVRADVIKSERFPWIVTLHDLSVISEVIDRPSEFLLYLRRRTESEVSLKFQSIDELDLFMLFLTGGLYVEPDPDRVSEEFLGVRRPTRGDRRRYRAAAVPTRVMTHTDPLDAWVYFQEGSSDSFAPKPTFASHPAVLELIDFLFDGRKPGWFRFAADLLNLAEDAQESLAKSVDQLLSMTTADGQHHNALMTFAGAWGYPSLFIGSKPTRMPQAEASRRLAIYGMTKKHQLKSDRALMVLFDERRNIRSVRYDSNPPRDDVRLDEAGTLMGLIPAETMGRPVPPSARRTTKRLNPPRKNKKRR